MIHQLIEKQLRLAVASIDPPVDPQSIQVVICQESQYGDYMTNSLMGIARQRKLNPRQFATEIKARLELDEYCESIDVAGAGFLNFRLKTEAIGQVLRQAIANGDSLFEKAIHPRTYVVDFSSPNVAKAMHVGHIRSTILGDCLARILKLLGHKVITDNHLGDWGTQFGKLILGWKTQLNQAQLEIDPISEMERIYKSLNAACDADPALYESAKRELANLQAGDEANLAIWKRMISLSQIQFDQIYSRLGVVFDHTLGESFYNGRLKSLVQDFTSSGLAHQHEGAVKIFFDDLPELKDHPAVIQKNDGAATYTTTDLATLEYRLQHWQPDEIIYVTDGRQQLHFKEVFTAFQRWMPGHRIKLNHVWFGSILGEDGKPFKTRSGEVVKLSELLNEAEERAQKVVAEKNPNLDQATQKEIARVVGIGAVKYADLLPNRQSDYVFSWDKMLSFNGNTAPYLLYAYTRVRSIFRKLAETGEAFESTSMPEKSRLEAPEEIKLAKHLLNFGFALQAVIADWRPNFLCNYLYDLAGFFARFWEACPVLKAEPPMRQTRLGLCALTGQVLKQGLEALGLETTDKM